MQRLQPANTVLEPGVVAWPSTPSSNASEGSHTTAPSLAKNLSRLQDSFASRLSTNDSGTIQCMPVQYANEVSTDDEEGMDYVLPVDRESDSQNGTPVSAGQ